MGRGPEAGRRRGGWGGLRRERAPALCAPPTTHNSYDLWEMLEPHGSQCLLSSRISRSGYRPSPGGGPHHGLRPQTGWSCRSTLVLRPLPFTYCRETRTSCPPESCTLLSNLHLTSCKTCLPCPPAFGLGCEDGDYSKGFCVAPGSQLKVCGSSSCQAVQLEV